MGYKRKEILCVCVWERERERNCVLISHMILLIINKVARFFKMRENSLPTLSTKTPKWSSEERQDRLEGSFLFFFSNKHDLNPQPQSCSEHLPLCHSVVNGNMPADRLSGKWEVPLQWHSSALENVLFFGVVKGFKTGIKTKLFTTKTEIWPTQNKIGLSPMIQ